MQKPRSKVASSGKAERIRRFPAKPYEILARALLLSSTFEVSLTSWIHEHFTSYLLRFLGLTDLLLRLSLADISQAILGKPQVLTGNRKRYWRSLKASQTLWDTIQKYERSYPAYKTAVFVCIEKSDWFYSYHWEFRERWNWKYCQAFNCAHSNVLSSTMQNSHESAIF